MKCFVKKTDKKLIRIYPILPEKLSEWSTKQTYFIQKWVSICTFEAKSGSYCLIPNSEGSLQCVLLGVDNTKDFWAVGALPKVLPKGTYQLSSNQIFDPVTSYRSMLAWGLGSYQFLRYKTVESFSTQLLLPNEKANDIVLQVSALNQGRDLINTSAEDMNPEALSKEIQALGKKQGAKIEQIVGNDLLAMNYPAIHAVGRGSMHAPRLVDLHWGDSSAPRLTLVGKGVCFDTGGLDIKSSKSMRLMKKDMTGAAQAMSLAYMLMELKIPVKLRVLIPAVENVVDGCSYRPGDVITTRAGITVEIHNTDAEGRMIMCDALTAAVEDQPELLIDFSSLTGAACVALGPDIPTFFCNNDQLAQELESCANSEQDPVWRLPLYQPYSRYLKSTLADCVNASSSGFAGAITAALYLQQFVPDNVSWIHFDLAGWNAEDRPGRPKGGEILGLRALVACLKKRYQYR